MTKRSPEMQAGYRHGKHDYCYGLRSPDLLTAPSEYAQGYRAGLAESEAIQAKWIEAEDARHS